MEEVVTDTIVLSDLHLGSEVSRARDALRLLRQKRFRRLVLLGDIFSDLNFGRLKKDHWRFLSWIRKLSNPRRNVEVVWVEGNHDHGLTEVMSHLVGVRVYQEYVWTYAGVKHLAIHGHQFDRFAIDNAFLSRFGALIYLHLQKLDRGKKRVVRSLDGLNTRWLQLSSKVSAGAMAYARQRGAERVFCGHTHVAMQAERDGVAYFNSGSWVSARATYITVDAGGVHIHEYGRTDDRHPGEERSEADPEAVDLAFEADLLAEPDGEGVCC